MIWRHLGKTAFTCSLRCPECGQTHCSQSCLKSDKSVQASFLPCIVAGARRSSRDCSIIARLGTVSTPTVRDRRQDPGNLLLEHQRHPFVNRLSLERAHHLANSFPELQTLTLHKRVKIREKLLGFESQDDYWRWIASLHSVEFAPTRENACLSSHQELNFLARVDIHLCFLCKPVLERRLEHRADVSELGLGLVQSSCPRCCFHTRRTQPHFDCVASRRSEQGPQRRL